MHPRAGFAARIRDQVRVLGYADPGRSALAVIGLGIAGLTELSFELEDGRRGQGGGTGLVRDALTAIPSGELVLAAVAPGNAASVRALLSAGFIPLGSVQLFRRASHHHGGAPVMGSQAGARTRQVRLTEADLTTAGEGTRR